MQPLQKTLIKQLDSYSLLICSKYLNQIQDYINVMCICKKFKETTEKLRYNPISIKSLKLFPKIQTQYLYSKNDVIIEQILNHEIWYEVNYEQYLKLQDKQVKCHYVLYNIPNNHNTTFNGIIPNGVTILNTKYNFNQMIKSIIIPTSLTSLRKNCFQGWIKMSTISLPSSLTSLPFYGFDSCKSLTAITLPSSLRSIGNHCFFYCEKLKTIDIPNSVFYIGSGCFQACYSLSSLKFPKSLNTLENTTFDYCTTLSSIILPTTLILISDKCFCGCLSLQTIILPTTLKHIGNGCFRNCQSLKKIEIPNSVQFIGIDCFFNCSSLTDMKFQSHINEFTFKVSYGDSILYKKYGITCNNIILTRSDVMNNLLPKINNSYSLIECIIPNGIVEIEDEIFFYKENPRSIIIPTTVTSIGNNCFVGCKSLTSLSIPSSIKKIGMNCFERCLKLKEVILPTQFQNKYPFKVTYNVYLILNKCNIHCSKVLFNTRCYYDNFLYKIPTDFPLILDMHYQKKEKEIPNNVIQIKRSFLSFKVLNVTIPTSVTKLCDNCFKDYPKLRSITIPTTVQCIGKHLIDGCTSLTKLNYEGDWNNIVVSYDDYLRYKSIGLIFNSIEYTKEDINKYGNVTPTIVNSLQNSCYDRSTEVFHIPTHITSLSNRMFEPFFQNYENKMCPQLRSICIPTSIQTIPKYCFGECYLLTHIELPPTLKVIKKKAFYKCISLQSIIIPPSVVTIEQHAFDDCYSLTSITLPTPLPTLGKGCFKGCNQLNME